VVAAGVTTRGIATSFAATTGGGFVSDPAKPNRKPPGERGLAAGSVLELPANRGRFADSIDKGATHMSTPATFLKWILLAVLLAGCQVRPPAVADPSAAPADKTCSWPRFHGPHGDNISTETGLLRKWPEQGPKLAFVAKGIGEGFAGVTIADGLIYTCGNIDEKTVITALDLGGNIQWQVDNGGAWTGEHPGTRGTPTIDGHRLYHESPLGEVVCLKAKTGERIWNLNILEQFGSENISWALAESLLVDGDRVICSPGGPNTAVVALDKMTGKTIWKSPSADGDLAGYATPTLAEYQGLRMIFTLTSKAVMGVNADTGDLLFRFPHKTDYDVNVLEPIFHDAALYVSTGYGSGSVMLKVHVDGQKATVEELWRSRALDNHHGGVILLDGYLYGSAHGGRWVCLDWQTGKTMYQARGVGKGSLTCAEGMLYTLSEKSQMGLVQATPEGHEVISEFSLPEGGEGPSWAHPVVCGGRLYVRHGDFLYAYDVRAAE
jgi:outer membrane protein assembly factor BamB